MVVFAFQAANPALHLTVISLRSIASGELFVMNSRPNGEFNNMDVNRKIVKRLKLNEDIDDGYVQMDMAELISIMWEITQDAWSFMKGQNAEQRLQRDVAIVTGRTS